MADDAGNQTENRAENRTDHDPKSDSGSHAEADLHGRTVAFLVAMEGVEQAELTEPWAAVERAGGRPVLLSTDAGKVQAFNHLDKGDTFAVDERVARADVAAYDALVLPGGVANPDALRTDPT